MQLRLRQLIGILAVLAVLSVGTPALAGNHVVDDAQMFSATTVDELNQRIDRIGDAYKKEVFIVTVPSMGGRTPDAIGARYASGRTVNGIFILIAKAEKKTLLSVGSSTARLFNGDRQKALKGAINSQFKTGNFDAGILAGVSYIDDTFRTGMASRGSVPAAPFFNNSQPLAATHSSGGGFPWMGIILIGLVIFVVVQIIKALRGNQVGYGPGPGGPGYTVGPGMPMQQGGGWFGGGGGGGNGFLGGLLGGIGGAVVGNALYDEFGRRRNDEEGGHFGSDAGGWGGGGQAAPPSQPDWQQQDTSSSWGSDSGSSWGDSSGGSSFSDSSGGSDSGGGGGGGDWS